MKSRSLIALSLMAALASPTLARAAGATEHYAPHQPAKPEKRKKPVIQSRADKNAAKRARRAAKGKS